MSIAIFTASGCAAGLTSDKVKVEPDLDKILVTRSSMPGFQEYVDEIKDLWDTHWLTNMGEKHQKLQRELKDYLKTDNLELLVNGHMALELILQAFDLKGEVITTPFTFASTTHAIVRNGLTPVFCDIDPDDLTIDVSKIEALITDKTCAILPVHVYGNICDVDGIDEIAGKYGLKVIYDAAHAFGEIYKGRGVMDYGDASILSFHATKVFNTIEGGAVSFRDDRLTGVIRGLRDFGIEDGENVTAVGANAKMNEFSAAMGLCNLRHIDGEIEKRKKVYERYMERLEGIKGIRVRHPDGDTVSNYAYFPVVFEPQEFGSDRDEVAKALADNNIFARKYFYPATNEFGCYKGKFDGHPTPVAADISRKVLSLPFYADLEEKTVDRICEIIKRF